MKIDWIHAKAEYLSNPAMSYRDVAQNFGVSLTSVKERAAKEGWQSLRLQTLLEVDQKLPEKLGEIIAETRVRHFEIGQMMIDKGIEAFETEVEITTARAALATVVAGIKVEREALGLDARNFNTNTLNSQQNNFDLVGLANQILRDQAEDEAKRLQNGQS